MIPSTAPADTAALVHAAQQGETEAFTRLIDAHVGLVFTIARSRLGDHESAEDLVQEVFLRVHLNLQRLRDPARFAPWVSRLTRHLAIDWQRRGQRRSRLVPMVPLEEIPTDPPDTATQGAREMVEHAQQSDALRSALERLTPDQRTVVMLHFGEELSQREIAERLGVNATKVHRLLRRGLAAMRGMLEETVRVEAPRLRMPRAVASRTAALIGAVAALGGAERAALAATAASTAPAEPTAATLLVSSVAAKLAAGGVVMNTVKGVIAVGAAVAIGVLGYQRLTAGQEPDTPRPEAQASSASEPVTGPVEFAMEMLPVGETISNRMRIDIQSHVPFPPQMSPVQSVSLTLEGESRTEVVAHTDQGGMELDEEILALQITRAVGDGREITPGAVEATDIPGMSIEQELEATRIRMTVDRRGRIVAVDVMNDLNPNSNALIQEMMFLALSGLPEGPAQVGTTWTETVHVPGISTESQWSWLTPVNPCARC